MYTHLMKKELLTMPTKTKKKVKKKRKPRKREYCQRCGGKLKSIFQINLTPTRKIEVCTSCFEWARPKTMTEIREDYAKRSRRNING